MRTERGDVSTDSADIKRKIREYYEQFYPQKFDNLNQITNSSEAKLSKLTKYSIDNLNSPLAITETDFIVKNLLKNSYTGPDNFTG